MEQLTIFDFLQEDKNRETFKTCFDNTKEIVFNVLEREEQSRNLKLKKGFYKSYNIEVGKNQKIKSIKFYFYDKSHKKGQFEILIKDYLVEEKEIKEAYGGNYKIVSISNLQIGKIGKKLKNGYEYRDNINQYKQEFGIDFKNTKDFIIYILKKYHLNN